MVKKRIIRTFTVLILSIAIFLILVSNTSALANPASVYCKELGKEFGGYEYKVKMDKQGNSYGVCAIDGKEYEAWDFYRGKIGKEYSYCSKNNYEIKTSNIHGKEEALCIVGNKEILVEDLLKLEEKLKKTEVKNMRQEFFGDKQSPVLSSQIQSLTSALGLYSFYNSSNYSSWDWRSPPNGTVYNRANFSFFDDSNGWLTPVKDQSTCGSCWSFGVNGAVESKYEINYNNSRLNPDLSEQYSISCDQTCAPDLEYCQYGCDGGWIDLSLNYLKNSGIADESCFPYTVSNGVCSNRCSDYSSRLWTIDGEDYSYYWFNFTDEELEQWIIDYGPVPVSMYMTYSIDGNGFLDCTPLGSSNHAVVLVGYNDTGVDSTSYWIIKNSWGSSWGQSGYFKVKYTEHCHIGDEVYLINITNPPLNFRPIITLNSPLNNSGSYNGEVMFNFSVNNKLVNISTCDLLINGRVNQTNSSVRNSTLTFFNLNMTNGNYNWSINCWENTLGIVNSSQTRSLVVDTRPPVISIISPVNNSWYNGLRLNVSINKAGNCWFNFNNSNMSMSNSSSTLFYYINLTIAETETNSSYNVTFYCNDSSGNFNSSSLVFFGISRSSPNITLISPEDNYSTSSSDIAFYYNATSSRELESCSLIIDNQISLTNSSVNLSLQQIFRKSLSAGNYNWSINCTDVLGNQANSSNQNITITPTIPSSSSGGGGGGGGEKGVIYSPTNSDMSKGYSKELKQNEAIKFSLNNEDHSLKVEKILDGYARVIISSVIINLTMKVGEEKKINVDFDDIFDLYLKLNSIVNNKANLTIKQINEYVAPAGENSKDSPNSKREYNSLANTENIGVQEFREDKNYIVLFPIVFIVISIILAFFIWKKALKIESKRKRRRY